MKELSQITTAFGSLSGDGKSAALATVIAVEGSSYRRPGARMLIASDGQSWGGVSGGCLERDVARRGRGVIETGRSVRCRYDTTDDEELAGGAATGCGGAVELFIQPVSAASPGALAAMRNVLTTRRPMIVATFLSAPEDASIAAGGAMALDDGTNPESAGQWMPELGDRSSINLPTIANVRGSEVFIERISPPQGLVIFGAGPDAAPLAEMAKLLGWHVTVVGTRPATGMPGRFPSADLLRVTSSDEPLENVEIRADAAVVLMTHNFARDIAILNRLAFGLPYLGVLGPRRRTDEVLAELKIDRTAEGIFAPVGLDLSAETPEQVALSILAEIQAVTRGATCKPLRDRPGPIHPQASRPQAGAPLIGSSTCPI